MTRGEILNKLGIPDPYLNYMPEYMKFSGWNSQSPNLELAKDKRVCLEIGSWMGNSAKRLAQIIPDDGVIICCDTFLGSHEHFLEKLIPTNKYGKLCVYEYFLSNTFRYGSKIIPVMLTSGAFFEVLRRLNICVDFVYIDGDHREQAVYNDILESYERLNDGGLIVGDDYDWETVKSGLLKTNIPYKINHNQFIITKEKNNENSNPSENC